MDNSQQDQAAAAAGPKARPTLYFAMWQRVPALEKAELLAAWGYNVRVDFSYSRDELDDAVDRLLALKPTAIVLSLDEFPGYSKALALGLKAKSGLRNIPQLAVGGETAQAEQFTRALPGVTHSTWDELQTVLADALGGDPPPANSQPLPSVKHFL